MEFLQLPGSFTKSHIFISFYYYRSFKQFGFCVHGPFCLGYQFLGHFGCFLLNILTFCRFWCIFGLCFGYYFYHPNQPDSSQRFWLGLSSKKNTTQCNQIKCSLRLDTMVAIASRRK